MHDVMRKRLWRKLDALPEERLYQVLDFIEFLESKYAPGHAPQPRGLQRFAERLEDGMRARAVTPRVMRRTVGLLGTAGRVLDGVAHAGRGLLREIDTTRPGEDASRGAPVGATRAEEASGTTRSDRAASPKPAVAPQRDSTHVDAAAGEPRGPAAVE